MTESQIDRDLIEAMAADALEEAQRRIADANKLQYISATSIEDAREQLSAAGLQQPVKAYIGFSPDEWD